MWLLAVANILLASVFWDWPGTGDRGKIVLQLSVFLLLAVTGALLLGFHVMLGGGGGARRGAAGHERLGPGEGGDGPGGARGVEEGAGSAAGGIGMNDSDGDERQPLQQNVTKRAD